jgi:hypothetical protein
VDGTVYLQVTEGQEDWQDFTHLCSPDAQNRARLRADTGEMPAQ